MRIAILTPCGPGHEWAVRRANSSVYAAWNYRRGPFNDIRHFVWDDREGKYGRSAGRNMLLEQAVKGWNADWIVNLDSNDFIHPAGFEALGIHMERNPDDQLIFGCHSMLLLAKDVRQAYRLNPGEIPDDENAIVHVYRTRYDICPLYWGHFVDHNVMGTVGTTSAIKASLAYRVGFLPELPAGDVHEFHCACMASAPFSKMARPLVVTDRVTPGAKAATADPLASHGDRLNHALAAIHEVWTTRGRVALTYDELEDRWRSRFKVRQDFERDVPRGTYSEEQWVIG